MGKHDTSAQAAPDRVKVWDPLVRFGHWLLVAAFFTAYIAGDDAQTVHVWAGYTVAAIVAWRLVWGVIGTRHARFSGFVRGPGAALAYLRGLPGGRSKRHLGHNPAGGLMVLALIVSLAGTTVTGMSLYAVEEGRGPLAGLIAPAGQEVSAETGETHIVQAYRHEDEDEHGDDGEDGGEWLEGLHKVFVYLTLTLVGLHVAGVLVSSLAHGENLVRAMITGRKRRDRGE